MNVEIGTEAPIFLFWEYLFQIFGILSLQCSVWTEMVKLVSCLVVLLAGSVAPQRKFRLFNALFTDCGKFFKGSLSVFFLRGV